MRCFASIVLGLVLFVFSGSFAFAQLDEIIVTASRIQAEPPGIVYTRRGDFLLLRVSIESDARDRTERLSEIKDTLKQMTSLARQDSSISLSFIDDANFVRPLSTNLYNDAIGFGSRPDTSVATIQVKTPIPENVSDAFALSVKLSRFVDQVKEKGRITVFATDEVTVSVVNAQQYRSQVVNKIMEDVNSVTAALGPNYRVVLEGLDKPMKSYRSGDLNLSFFLPYKYIVIPDSLTNYTVQIVDEDY